MNIRSLLWILLQISFNSYISCNHEDSNFITPESNKFAVKRANSSLNFFKSIFKSTFIDKTQLIEDFLHPDTPSGIYLTTPRRFGKTANLDMIAELLHFPIRRDELTYTKDKKITTRYILVQKHNNLSVFKNRSFFEENFANFLVLRVDLNINEDSLDELKKKINYRLHKTIFANFTRWWYKKGKYMICEHNYSIQFHCDLLTRTFEMPKFQRNNVSADALPLAIQYLKKFFDKRVILLIDHFDLSFKNALKYIGVKCADSILRYLSKMLDPLFKPIPMPWHSENEDTTPVHRALFVGITDLPIGIGTVYLSNVEIYNFLDPHPFYHHYGFQQYEVDGLLEKCNLQNHTDEVTLHYKGYLIRNTNITIYNPLSISSYLENKKIDSYWRRTGTISHWRRLCKHEEIFNALNNLANNRTIRLDKIDKPEVQIMESLFSMDERALNSSSSIANYFYHHLLQEGYLTPVSSSVHLYKSANFETLEEFQNVHRMCMSFYRQ